MTEIKIMKQKNIITTIAIIVLGFGGLIWFSRSQAPQSGNKGIINGSGSGRLAADVSHYDFGEISMAAGNVSYDYRIRNSGSEAVNVAKIYTSCMCTTAELIMGDLRKGPYGMPGHGVNPRINQTIDPGEEAVIRAVFDPAAHGPAGVGPVERVTYIEQKDGQVLELHFKATVKP